MACNVTKDTKHLILLQKIDLYFGLNSLFYSLINRVHEFYYNKYLPCNKHPRL